MKNKRLNIEVDVWFKSLTSMDREEVKKNIYDKWLAHVNYNTARGYLSSINKELSGIGVEPFEPKEFDLKKESKGVFTYQQLKAGIEFATGGVYNSQDMFMVLAIFNGILGKGYADLISLKKEKIDIDKGVILLDDGSEIIMDELMKKYAEQSMQEDVYFSVKNGRVGEYSINLNSSYILTAKPTKKNGNGTEPISYGGLRTRFYTTSESMDMELTMEGLYRSGVAYRMYVDGVDFERKAVYEWLEKNNIKVCKNTMLNIYRELYK